jgi:hypothetical protein
LNLIGERAQAIIRSVLASVLTLLLNAKLLVTNLKSPFGGLTVCILCTVGAIPFVDFFVSSVDRQIAAITV